MSGINDETTLHLILHLFIFFVSGINDKSTLHLVLRLRGGPSPDVQPLDLSRSDYEKQFEQQSMITQPFFTKPVTPACPPMPAVVQFTMTSQQPMGLTGQMLTPARPDPVPLYEQTPGVSSFGAQPVQAQMQQEVSQGGLFGAQSESMPSLFRGQPVQAHMSKVNEPIGGGGFSFGSKAPNAIDAFSFSEPIGGGGFSFGSPAPHNISFGMQSNSDLGVSGMCMGGTYQDRFYQMSSLRGLGTLNGTIGGSGPVSSSADSEGPVVSNIYIQ